MTLTIPILHVWAVGIIAFCLLNRRYPFIFTGHPHNQVQQQHNGSWKTRCRQQVLSSNKILQFLNSVLSTTPSMRPLAEELLESAWLSQPCYAEQWQLLEDDDEITQGQLSDVFSEQWAGVLNCYNEDRGSTNRTG